MVQCVCNVTLGRICVRKLRLSCSAFCQHSPWDADARYTLLPVFTDRVDKRCCSRVVRTGRSCTRVVCSDSSSICALCTVHCEVHARMSQWLLEYT